MWVEVVACWAEDWIHHETLLALVWKVRAPAPLQSAGCWCALLLAIAVLPHKTFTLVHLVWFWHPLAWPLTPSTHFPPGQQGEHLDS